MIAETVNEVTPALERSCQTGLNALLLRKKANARHGAAPSAADKRFPVRKYDCKNSRVALDYNLGLSKLYQSES
jgi:hypothetical protein